MSGFYQSISATKALHTRLSNDLDVQSFLGAPARLYDFAPADPVYPYLTYGPMRSEDVGGDGAPLALHSLSLHIWSRYGGRAEILQCLSAVSSAVENSAFVEVGAKFVDARIVYFDHFRSPDGRTLHGLLRLKIMTQPVLEAS